MKKDDLPNMLLAMMKNKDKVLHDLIGDFMTCQKYSKGCQRVLDNWDKYDSPDDQRKQLETAIKCNLKLMEICTRLSLIALLYAQGGEMDTDLAMALNKFGQGEDALKQMLKNKMGGK